METIDFEFNPYSEKYMRFLQTVHSAGYTVHEASQHHPYKKDAFYVTTEVDSETLSFLKLSFPEDTRIRPVREQYTGMTTGVFDEYFGLLSNNNNYIIYRPNYNGIE